VLCVDHKILRNAQQEVRVHTAGLSPRFVLCRDAGVPQRCEHLKFESRSFEFARIARPKPSNQRRVSKQFRINGVEPQSNEATQRPARAKNSPHRVFLQPLGVFVIPRPKPREGFNGLALSVESLHLSERGIDYRLGPRSLRLEIGLAPERRIPPPPSAENWLKDLLKRTLHHHGFSLACVRLSTNRTSDPGE